MRQRQSGRLAELNVVCAMLALAGVVLASQHPGFFALTLAALALPFIPMGIESLAARRRAAAADRHWDALLASGFAAAAHERARRGEGGSIIGVDANAGRIAFVSGDGSETYELAEVKGLSITRNVVYRWGDIGRTRHGFRFVVGSDAREYALSFPRRAQASRAFAALRGVLAGRVPIDDAEPR